MAKRPVFIAEKKEIGVKTEYIEFDWYPGMSINQKQKSIRSLHDEFKKKYKQCNILEISSKSEEKLGVELSAFNLKSKSLNNNIEFSVETAFQSSKIFENGGPFRDILKKTSKEAKIDIRLKNSGNLIGFNFFGKDFPIMPKTLFYDWLYINVLIKNEKFCNEIMSYDSFTDIEFNSMRSVNCQAYSAALFVSLVLNNAELKNLKKVENFFEITKTSYNKMVSQINMFKSK